MNGGYSASFGRGVLIYLAAASLVLLLFLSLSKGIIRLVALSFRFPELRNFYLRDFNT